MRTLESLTIKNFKSIREQTLQFGQLNIFIGANGSGKSNLIQVFRLLREIVNQNLARYSLEKGADALLHYGRKKSKAMQILVHFKKANSEMSYGFHLVPNDSGAFIIGNETIIGQVDKNSLMNTPLLLNGATSESIIGSVDHPLAKRIKYFLESCHIYHFHDTSDAALVKDVCDVDDNRVIRSQGENLAAFLYWMQQKHPQHFANIQDAVQQIAPFFRGFQLKPSKLNEEKIRLEWQDHGNPDAYFNAHSLSDGTLRFICLATLLLQPELPPIILLDEPELGLHPAAVNVLAGMLKSASARTQIIVATQSVTLLNQFDPDCVWTVEREDDQSVFKRLSEQDVSAWMNDYGLGELWEKNVFGARP